MQLSVPWNKAIPDRLKHHWFWRAILYPFALTRLAQLMIIYFSQVFLPFGSGGLPEWDFRLSRFLNAWAGWDSGWYLSIIKEGYHLNGAIDQVQSNIAFYPLYPYLVKIISWPVYRLFPKDSVLIGFGALLSNLFILAALVLLYKLVRLVLDDEPIAERTILYLLIFPAAIYFSFFYTEATFLFFIVAAFYLAKKGRWALAGLMAVFVSLARPLGVLIVIPLGILYLEAICWDFKKIRPDILWFGLAPLALLAYMASLYPVTGDLLAIFHIQAAWHKHMADPLTTLSTLPYPDYRYGIFQIDQLSLFLFLILGIVSIWKLPSLSFAAFPLLIVIPIFFNGSLVSINRICATLFPGFILLAKFGKHELAHKLILVVFFTLQVIFMTAWSRGYWVQ